MNVWNLIGIGAWIILVVYLIFIIRNIRQRHIKMIVGGKRTSGRTITIDIVEVLVFLAVGYGLFYAAWMRPVDYNSGTDVTVKYEYAPLVMQTDSDQSYYVATSSQNPKSPVRRYTYWSDGSKTTVSSQNADIAANASLMPVRASAYPWPNAEMKKLRELNKQTDSAFAATIKARYKNTFMNGLGMRAGREADYFTILRVPNEQLVEVKPLDK